MMISVPFLSMISVSSLWSRCLLVLWKRAWKNVSWSFTITSEQPRGWKQRFCRSPKLILAHNVKPAAKPSTWFPEGTRTAEHPIFHRFADFHPQRDPRNRISWIDRFSQNVYEHSKTTTLFQHFCESTAGFKTKVWSSTETDTHAKLNFSKMPNIWMYQTTTPWLKTWNFMGAISTRLSWFSMAFRVGARAEQPWLVWCNFLAPSALL